MNKKKLISISIILIFIMSIIIGIYSFYQEQRIKNTEKIVELNTSEIEVYSDIHLKKIISKINGKLINNPKIDTSKLGKKKITFQYITNQNIKVPYTISVKIVDKTPPLISISNVYSVTKNSDKKIEKEFFCGDNYDANPKCYIEGKYDLTQVGDYKLTYKAEDSSNNKSSYPFILKVKEEDKNNYTSEKEEPSSTKFSDVLNEYKTKNNKIGIDISHWQKDIDFQKIKKTGIEFAYIRVGRRDGINGKLILDDKFKHNIEGFNKIGIPVGIYFYSYANSKKDAIEEAKWVISKIKKYKVDLEIVFDWENWDNFQEFDLSFYELTEMANTFKKTVEENNYQGMLYSSKYYLENIWYPIKYNVWLAHYTKKTDYTGKYKVWQLCNNGTIDGINDNYVDIDIMYK